VAAPTRSVPHPGRALLVLFLLIFAMLLGILGSSLFNPSQWSHQFKVGLGLDLSSGTVVVMKATTPSGGVPDPGNMSTAVSIITSRVNGSGNTGATVQIQGNNVITVSVPGKTSQETVKLVSTTALLRFRQVLLYQLPGAATPAASASPSATPSASPSAKASGSPSPSASRTAKTSAKIVPEASPSASPTPSASGSASASASASASPSPSSSTPGNAVYGDTTNSDKKIQPAVAALFNKLTCKPGEDDTTWKKQVGYKDSADWDNLNSQIVSCDTTTGEKYLLDVAKVKGEDVTGASAGLNSQNNQWQVNLTLNGAGTSAFGTLTTYLYNTYAVNASTNPNFQFLDRVAIVLDGNVVSAPEINQGPITGGQAQITGNFTQADATKLANILKYGSLPVHLQPQSVQSVSPTLGRNQLDAGLLAGAIGLILVVVYSFLYYRGLGLVSVSSLIIAGLLAFLSVALLTKYQGFTLNLAGIAGLIVAIGITADSFVIFFERLRDEVREGKQLRPAVEAGWKRARRTILVSDTVSFLAALLLYYFAISDVKGFAYTLGLTTLIDVVVVFLFTKPMVTLLARTKFYGTGRPLSGLDPARLGARAPWRSSVPRTAVRRTSSARSSASRNTGEA
jgi:preprotein translocase subunit SecD